jgi:hypothetical protein
LFPRYSLQFLAFRQNKNISLALFIIHMRIASKDEVGTREKKTERRWEEERRDESQ